MGIECDQSRTYEGYDILTQYTMMLKISDKTVKCI